jgi:hypothetical protein
LQRRKYYCFVSPHYYFKHDHNWQRGSLEALMHKINMFDRTGVLTMVGFEGADWLEQYKKIHRRTK